MTHFSDTYRIGDAFYGRAAQSDGGQKGVALPVVVVKEFGAVAALTGTGIAIAASVTTAGAISATGSLVSGGVATFDVPRNVTMTATADTSSLTFTVNGTDLYGETQTETFTGPTGTATVAGKKAFKTVTSVVATGGSVTTGLTVGSGDVLGLPWHLANKGRFISITVDGVLSAAPTIVAGIGATGVATATNGDSRGTITATIATNAARYFTAMMIVVPTSKENLYGVTPA